MTAPYIIFIVCAGVALLLLMVLKFKLSAFISLLITSIFVGILAGMPLSKITTSIQQEKGEINSFGHKKELFGWNGRCFILN